MHRSEAWGAAEKRLLAAAGIAAAALLFANAVRAADPVRGASLYANPARPGFLPCADCHAENPIVNNFGNIWSGRNAVALIERAVQSNTGGMGVFQGVYGREELADIAAYLGNAPNTVAFPPTVLGTTSGTRTVAVSSSLKVGIDGLTLATEGDFVLAGTTCGNSLPRFSSCTVEISFRPASVGARAGTLVINHAGTPTPVRLPLGGEGLPPPAVAQVQPARIDFGAAGLRRHVEVANFSDAPLKLLSIAAEPAAFAIAGGTCLPGLTLATGQRCTVALRAPPRDGAEQRGTLLISHDGVGGGSAVQLNASGNALPGRRLNADRASLDFGTQPVGAAVPAQVVNVANTGTSPVTLGDIGASEPAFSLEGSTCAAGARLAPEQACQLVVTFRPSREGPLTAELRVGTQEQGLELRVPLAARAAASALAVAPGRLAMQAQTGSTAPASLALVNAGSTPWRISRITFSGPEAADFSLAGGAGCGVGATVAPGTHCTLTVVFTPRASGGSNARLRIETDAGGTDVDLAGRGTAAAAAAVWLDASAIDFGAQGIGGAGATRSIDVHNRGDAELRWSQVALTGSGAGQFSLGGDCVPGAALAAGSSCRIELRFGPGQQGEHAASLVLWHESGPTPAAVSLRGRGAAAASALLVADRPAIDFGRWPRQTQAAAQRLRLRNGGATAAPPLGFVIDDPAFTIARAEPACGSGIPPGASCTIEIEFKAPAADGARKATLAIAAAGLPATSITLGGEAVSAAPLLAWQPSSVATTHAPTFVGATVAGPAWTLVNLGNAPSAPLRWVVDGAASGDFSLAAGSTCEAGRVLAPGAGCTVQMAFHPQAAGAREARLVLASDSLDPAALEGRGIATAYGGLLAAPASVVFQARTTAAAGPQRVRLSNDSPAALRIDTLAIEGTAFSFATSPADACGGELRVLLPGEECEFAAAWDGSAAGALGGRLQAGSADGFGASVPLLVREDPAQRTNVGGGGGGAWHWGWLPVLGLLMAARRAVRSESPHA